MLGLTVLLSCDKQDEDVNSHCPKSDTETSPPNSFENKVHDIVDKVMHSKVMEDLQALPNDVIEELKALPGELKESLLHVEQRSYVVAGVVVAIGAALLLLGCLWVQWCHAEHGEYRYIPVSQVEEFEKYQNILQSFQPSDVSGKAKKTINKDGQDIDGSSSMSQKMHSSVDGNSQ